MGLILSEHGEESSERAERVTERGEAHYIVAVPFFIFSARNKLYLSFRREVVVFFLEHVRYVAQN